MQFLGDADASLAKEIVANAFGTQHPPKGLQERFTVQRISLLAQVARNLDGFDLVLYCCLGGVG